MGGGKLLLTKIKNDYASWLLLITIGLLLLEVLFFNKGLIFSLLLSSAMVYFGRKKLHRLIGKILFWAGIFFLIGSIIGMFTFRFLFLAVFIYFVIQLIQSKQKPNTILPIMVEPSEFIKKDEVISRKPLLQNVLFGSQKTPNHTYEWDDINIQAGIGDTVIDLSYTVLPKGETVIFIRNIIGNIQLLIPYDVEVSVNHSVIAGSVTIFDFHEPRIFNQNLHIQTSEYENHDQKIKIFTSLVLGNIEVRRI